MHKSGRVETLPCVHAALVYFAARRCAVCMRVREAVCCCGLRSWMRAASFLLRPCCEGRLNPCSLPSWSCLKFSETFPQYGDVLPGETIKPCFSRSCEGFGWVWPPTTNSFPRLHAPPPPVTSSFLFCYFQTGSRTLGQQQSQSQWNVGLESLPEFGGQEVGGLWVTSK